MQISIKRELNPVFETICLLIMSRHFEQEKADVILALNDMGIEGETFYKNNLSILDKYLKSFRNNIVHHPQEDFFLGEYNAEYYIFLATTLIEHPEWFTNFEEITTEQLIQSVVPLLLDDADQQPPNLDTMEGCYSFLEALEIGETTKWKLITILKDPKRWFDILITICRTNIPAYEKAVREVKKDLDKLLKQCPEYVDPTFGKILNTFSKNPVIYASLAAPLVELVGTSIGFLGLFVDKAFRSGKDGNKSKETLLFQLKTIGDKSKFEILCSLKSSPKYNLEIAEQLNLTAATMSHHMRILLSSGLVTIEKTKGKVYYHLDTEQIRSLISSLEEQFL